MLRLTSFRLVLTFPKSVRLALSSEFLRVKTEGRSYSGRLLTLGVLKNAGSSKAGVITSRRVGGAVVRNRVRRRLRELLRATRPEWIPGVWLVVVARNAASTATFEELRQEWLRLAQRSGVLPKATESVISETPPLRQEDGTRS